MQKSEEYIKNLHVFFFVLEKTSTPTPQEKKKKESEEIISTCSCTED
jgi:hypothetical protein